jgi:hypothetical protein
VVKSTNPPQRLEHEKAREAAVTKANLDKLLVVGDAPVESS